MFFLVGFLVVMGCVMGGFLASGGHIEVLWQPFEFLIIFGSALGAFIIANPKQVLTGTAKSMGCLLKGPRYSKKNYLELLCLLFGLFKLAKTKGDLALEAHVEKPHDSPLFQQFPTVMKDHHALDFLCDYLRLLTIGTTTPHEIETVMEAELQVHHGQTHAISGALQTTADALPALGIVAAVLGVIHTMGSITEPPEVLGHLIGGALVGTFCGVLAAYGVVAPMARSLEGVFAAEGHYMDCMKVGLLAHIQGYAPQVSVEFARKTLTPDVRPTFKELEDMLRDVKV